MSATRRARGAFSRHRLFWRVYLHSLLLIVIVALFLFGMGMLFRDHAPWERLPRAVATELRGLPPAARPARLAEIAPITNLDLVLYDRLGTILAEARSPGACPLEALDLPGALAHLRPDDALRVGHGYRAVALDAGAVVAARWRGYDPRRFVYAAAGLLVLLALLSWPAVWAVARPMERLIAAVDEVSAGDLSARVGRLGGPPDLARLGLALDAMWDNLARLRAHERALLANISHELRTPMARIRVALEWAAEEGALPAPLEGVEGDLAELEGLIEDVLASARLDPALGGGLLRREPVPVAALVSGAAERFIHRHPTLALRCPPAPEGCVDVDARLAHRVLDNLLDNAARYGGGPVTLSCAAAPGAVAFTVRDHGPGVAPEELGALFDAFWRAERSRCKTSGGVGLGLTLCQRVVEAHGGQIEASLPEGGGLAVRFTLPLAAA